jgi:hypothetical protein
MRREAWRLKSSSTENDTIVESRALDLVSQVEAAFADYGAPLAQSLPMPSIRPRRRTSTSSVESLGVAGLRLLWMLRLLWKLRLLCLGLIAANRLNRIIVNLGPLPIHSSRLLPTE